MIRHYDKVVPSMGRWAVVHCVDRVHLYTKSWHDTRKEAEQNCESAYYE